MFAEVQPYPVQAAPPPKPAPKPITTTDIRRALGKIWLSCRGRWFMPATCIRDAAGRQWIWRNVGVYFERHPDPALRHLVRLAAAVERRISSIHAAVAFYKNKQAANQMWADLIPL